MLPTEVRSLSISNQADSWRRNPDQGGGPEYPKHLESNTQLAADRGVFGSTTFVVGDEMFFGNDRLDFLEGRLNQS